MPYKDIQRQREYVRDWQRRNAGYQRSFLDSIGYQEPQMEELPPLPEDPVSAFVEWAEDTLRVPTGPLMSKGFRIPDWQREFLEGAMGEGIIEAGLSVARKNGKSGLIAAWLLACLAGPLVRREWRGVVVSLTGYLAKELKNAMEGTALQSGLQGLRFYSTPIPGRVTGRCATRVDFLAADKATGHAIGADMVIIDEAGLLPENSRALWNAVMSSISGRNGRLLAISIKGDGPMFREIEERADDESVHWVEYAARPDASYGDEQAWHDANPGLSTGIKSITYMRRMARRALDNPRNGPDFAAYDLNLPQEPSRELILTLNQWTDAVQPTAAPRSGPAVVGLDLGASASMTAAVAYWPDTGRLECYAAFPSNPDLRARGEADGVGGLYQRMYRDGELLVMPGRTTPVLPFIRHVADRLTGEVVLGCGFDRYRRQEALDAFQTLGLHWPQVFRGQGASTTADGSFDVRAFQEEVLGGMMKPTRSLLMETAIACSSISRDAAGNPKLDKATARGRIDVLQAGVIAAGLGKRYRAESARSRGGRYLGAIERQVTSLQAVS